jgi:hypothetical protein
VRLLAACSTLSLSLSLSSLSFPLCFYSLSLSFFISPYQTWRSQPIKKKGTEKENIKIKKKNKKQHQTKTSATLFSRNI